MGVLSWLIFICSKREHELLCPLVCISHSVLTFYFLENTIEIFQNDEDGFLRTQACLMLAVWLDCLHARCVWKGICQFIHGGSVSLVVTLVEYYFGCPNELRISSVQVIILVLLKRMGFGWIAAARVNGIPVNDIVCINVRHCVAALELFIVRPNFVLLLRSFHLGFSEIAFLTIFSFQFLIPLPWLVERRWYCEAVFRLNFDWGVWVIGWSIQKFGLKLCDFSLGCTLSRFFKGLPDLNLSISSPHLCYSNYNYFTQTILQQIKNDQHEFRDFIKIWSSKRRL